MCKPDNVQTSLISKIFPHLKLNLKYSYSDDSLLGLHRKLKDQMDMSTQLKAGRVQFTLTLGNFSVPHTLALYNSLEAPGCHRQQQRAGRHGKDARYLCPAGMAAVNLSKYLNYLN